MKVDKPFLQAMRQATQLVRMRGPVVATRFIQGLLRGKPARDPVGARPKHFDVPAVEVLDPLPSHEVHAPPRDATLPAASGEFLNERFSGPAGARNYKLYVPSHATGVLPLVVMLHGCTQNPDDFATGTRANRWAESRRCLVAYPEQIQLANANRCWNWFRPGDQQADHGEPAIIAGIVRQIIATHPVDARRVYVAGLSAGGAMAAIMAHAYPDLFAAAAVHSGLPVGAAHDVQSAFAAMKSGRSLPAARVTSVARAVPLIVLHGDADHTVNPVNADRLVEAAVETYAGVHLGAALQTNSQTIEATDLHRAYRRTRYTDRSDLSQIEQWEIRGAGHAWSGGDAKGSFADARGPDATQAMLDFFHQHTTPESVAAPHLNGAPAAL